MNARRVQRTRGRIQGAVRRLYLARSPIDGIGAFAGAFIPQGSYVTRCQGVLLDASDVTDDMRAMQVGPATYLANTPGTSTIDDFLNHSCNPNVGFKDGSVALYALRDIQAGDELVFDYSTCMNERGWWIRCRCRVARCRNRVTSFCDLPMSEQRRLEPIALAYLRSSASCQTRQRRRVN